MPNLAIWYVQHRSPASLPMRTNASRVQIEWDSDYTFGGILRDLLSRWSGWEHKKSIALSIAKLLRYALRRGGSTFVSLWPWRTQYWRVAFVTYMRDNITLLYFVEKHNQHAPQISRELVPVARPVAHHPDFQVCRHKVCYSGTKFSRRTCKKVQRYC